MYWVTIYGLQIVPLRALGNSFRQCRVDTGYYLRKETEKFSSLALYAANRNISLHSLHLEFLDEELI